MQGPLCFCVYRRRNDQFEKLFHDIQHEKEYASLSRHQKLIIREGLTRWMCIQRAYVINEPEKVTEECKKYTSYL